MAVNRRTLSVAACLWVVLAQPAMADHKLSSGEPNAPQIERGR